MLHAWVVVWAKPIIKSFEIFKHGPRFTFHHEMIAIWQAKVALVSAPAKPCLTGALTTYTMLYGVSVAQGGRVKSRPP